MYSTIFIYMYANVQKKFQKDMHKLSSLENAASMGLEVVVKEKFRLACNITVFQKDYIYVCVYYLCSLKLILNEVQDRSTNSNMENIVNKLPSENKQKKQNETTKKRRLLCIPGKGNNLNKTWEHESIRNIQIIMAFEIEIYHLVTSTYWI